MIQRLILFLSAFGVAAAPAEHRVALIIGDGSGMPDLEERGYRCQSSENLNEKEFLRLVEGFSATTPTNGTALVYFKGEVREDHGDLQFVTPNGRAVAMAKVIELLRDRGGSANNRIVVDSSVKAGFEPKVPEGFYFSYAEGAKLAPGSAPSIAISPPETFVPGEKAGDEWVNSRGMVFCWIPPGKYTAGSPEDTPGRYPDEERREVVIDDGFWMGKYELTVGQQIRRGSNKAIGTLKLHPVESLHWDDGSRAVKVTLTEEERKAGRLPAGWQYHLPSEEQWEYAARAGTGTRYYFGDDMNLLPEHANFADKSFYESGDIYSNHAHRTLDDGYVRLAPVGSFKPNTWGLHDMYGNVSEWCRDHAAKGGSWISVGENCRSAYHDSYSSRDEQIYLGYRLVIQPNVPDPKKN